MSKTRYLSSISRLQNPGFLPKNCRRLATQVARRRIKIVEVSPRDGLQNERTALNPHLRANLILKLADAGLKCIEAGSFVSPKWVPQMSGTDRVLLSPEVRSLLSKYPRSPVSLPVLVPNLKGLQNLLSISESPPTDEIAIFAAATESFSNANINVSISDSLKRLEEVAVAARAKGLKVRGYVSCVVGCPYEGEVDPKQVRIVTEALLQMGCYEVSLGDTIGVGTPESFERLLNELTRTVKVEKLAAHCHDTFGTAVANVLALVRAGIPTVDSSIAGFGGCPYSPGATGNVATEDVVFALESEGYDTGLLSTASDVSVGHYGILNDEDRLRRLEQLALVGEWISDQVGRENGSRVGKAVLARLKLRTGQESAIPQLSKL